MRINENDVKRKCKELSKLTGESIRMISQNGYYFCAVSGEHGSIARVVTDYGTKREVYYQMCRMVDLLNYMGFKKLSIHYGEE